MTMGGEQVERGHAVVQTLAAVHEGDTLVVPKLGWLARFFPDARAIARARGNTAACMPRMSIPSTNSPRSPQSQDQPSIAHSTGSIPFSLRSCTLPESTHRCSSNTGVAGQHR